jgi:hypothetical protein
LPLSPIQAIHPSNQSSNGSCALTMFGPLFLCCSISIPFSLLFLLFLFSSYFSLFIEQLTSVYLTRFDKGRKHLKEGGGEGRGKLFISLSGLQPPPWPRPLSIWATFHWNLESLHSSSSFLGEKGKLIFISFRVN